MLVLGSPTVFDPRTEYDLPAAVRRKMHFCGYIRRTPGARRRDDVRRAMGLEPHDRLVLVTAGGGQDGQRLIGTYQAALGRLHACPGLRSLIITGPEMTTPGLAALASGRMAIRGVEWREFADDIMSDMAAADVVVCMGGYNTLCEVATLRKRAVVVPRTFPVREQWMRTSRWARLGLVTMMEPEVLDADGLACALRRALSSDEPPPSVLDMGALPRIARVVTSLLRAQAGMVTARRVAAVGATGVRRTARSARAPRPAAEPSSQRVACS